MSCDIPTAEDSEFPGIMAMCVRKPTISGTSAGKLIAKQQAQGGQTKPVQSAPIFVRRQNQGIRIAPVRNSKVWLWNLNRYAVTAIGEPVVDSSVDEIANSMHRTIAHHKIAAAGVLTAEVCPAPRATVAPVGCFTWGMVLVFERPPIVAAVASAIRGVGRLTDGAIPCPANGVPIPPLEYTAVIGGAVTGSLALVAMRFDRLFATEIGLGKAISNMLDGYGASAVGDPGVVWQGGFKKGGWIESRIGI